MSMGWVTPVTVKEDGAVTESHVGRGLLMRKVGDFMLETNEYFVLTLHNQCFKRINRGVYRQHT